MGMIVLLLDEGATATSVDTATAARLADLGISNVSLLRDDSTIALVLDGWGFDPALGGPAAAALFGPATKVLRPVLQTTVMSGGTSRTTAPNG